METWFFFALLSTVFAGLITFILKVTAQHNFDGRLVVSLSFLTLGIFSGITWIINGAPVENMTFIIVTGAITGLTIGFANYLKVPALKYIDTAIFLPIYKTLSPILVVLAGYLFFTERFTTFEAVGVAAGIVVPLLLLHKSEKDRQNNLMLGLVILVISAISAAVSVLARKYAVDGSIDIWFFLAVNGFAGFLIPATVYMCKHSLMPIFSPDAHMRKILLLGLGLGVLEIAISFSFMMALVGPVSIVYTINSFYILIPIVLSVWLYNEHMNLRKGIAIALSILAIIFFGL